MTATTRPAAALARCDGGCEAWHPQTDLEQIGRLRYCGPCATWERRARRIEEDERRAASVAALTPTPRCLPSCRPCRDGLPYEHARTYELDGKPYGHAINPAYRWSAQEDAERRAAVLAARR
jgi:hypothetical protein